MTPPLPPGFRWCTKGHAEKAAEFEGRRDGGYWRMCAKHRLQNRVWQAESQARKRKAGAR